MNIYKYGDIYWANLPHYLNSNIQSGVRPVMIVSNNKNNHFSNIIQTVPLTTRDKKKLPTHVAVNGYGLTQDSIALCEQIITTDKGCLISKVGHIDNQDLMKLIQKAIMLQLNIDDSVGM